MHCSVPWLQVRDFIAVYPLLCFVQLSSHHNVRTRCGHRQRRLGKRAASRNIHTAAKHHAMGGGICFSTCICWACTSIYEVHITKGRLGCLKLLWHQHCGLQIAALPTLD
jgi:hypothetical protein